MTHMLYEIIYFLFISFKRWEETRKHQFEIRGSERETTNTLTLFYLKILFLIITFLVLSVIDNSNFTTQDLQTSLLI